MVINKDVHGHKTDNQNPQETKAASSLTSYSEWKEAARPRTEAAQTRKQKQYEAQKQWPPTHLKV